MDVPPDESAQHPDHDRVPSTNAPVEVRPEFDDHHDAGVDAVALQQLLLTTSTVQEFLEQLVRGAAADTNHRCSITVGPPDAQHDAYTVASSDEVTRRLDELQYADGQGPCLEALRGSVPVFVTDMQDDTRWPQYLPHATAVGARSSLSYPLRTGETTIGAINFYAFEPLVPQIDLQARAGELANIAAGALALAIRLAQRGDMIDHLRTALTSRSTIDRAMGILMAQQRCSAHAAFDLLRRASQGRNIKLRDVAAGIVDSLERGSPGDTSGRY